MAWFRKEKRRLPPPERRETPDGVWIKCIQCGEIIYRKELARNLSVCSRCGHHFPIPSQDYLALLLDEGSFVEYDGNLQSTDPLTFKDSKRYSDRLKENMQTTGRSEAVICGVGAIQGRPVSIAVMDFDFMGGSMGSVVGEKVTRTIRRASERRIPAVVISRSGGARMQEGILSLMQMAKTSGALALLGEAGIPFLSILTHPTTGGVTASFASLGDLVLAEPRALVGFAGPRVIEQTIGQELPEGFQLSEFLLEHGMIDMIVHRRDLRATVARLLTFLGSESASPRPAARPGP